MSHSWLRIAHRGASGSAPEHTRAAFVRALGLGVDMIELDVQLSRDEQLIVIHDHELERTTSGTGLVRHHTLAELRALDAGAWFASGFAGERILTLDEVVELVAGRARLNVELKAPAPDWPILVPRLLAVLGAGGLSASAVVSCFDPEALVAVRALNAGVRLGLLWQHQDVTEAWRWAQELQAVSIHPFWMLVSPDLVAAAHARRLQVLVWTVNDPSTMRALVTKGVDGIMSDFPERLFGIDDALSA